MKIDPQHAIILGPAKWQESLKLNGCTSSLQWTPHQGDHHYDDHYDDCDGHDGEMMIIMMIIDELNIIFVFLLLLLLCALYIVQVEALLVSSCKELMEAWTLTNKNLSERILETERAKKQSMENLETTNQDLTNMDYNIKLLKKALEEKNPSKMVAESRLEVNKSSSKPS